MLAIGYVRVSTGRQAEEGVSLAAQAENVRAMATVHSAELVEVIVDGGESAKSMNRPGLKRVLEMVTTGKAQAMIVAKLDRLTRSVKDLCELLELFERRGAALMSVAESLDTSTAAGRLVITIMGAISQWEREAIGEGTRDALQHKWRKGERVGNVRYGFKLCNDAIHVEANPAEHEIVARIHHLRTAGHTLRGIADQLNHAGYRTRRGSPWRMEQVNRVLKLEKLTG